MQKIQAQNESLVSFTERTPYYYNWPGSFQIVHMQSKSLTACFTVVFVSGELGKAVMTSVRKSTTCTAVHVHKTSEQLSMNISI